MWSMWRLASRTREVLACANDESGSQPSHMPVQPRCSDSLTHNVVRRTYSGSKYQVCKYTRTAFPGYLLHITECVVQWYKLHSTKWFAATITAVDGPARLQVAGHAITVARCADHGRARLYSLGATEHECADVRSSWSVAVALSAVTSRH